MSVVIPTQSPERLPLLLAALPPVHELIIVVGTAEDTALALPRAARVIRQTRSGSGNAVACGVATATGDIIVTLPGDGSCDPAEVPAFVAALRGGADMAYGSRRRITRPTDLILLWFMGVLLGCRPADPGFGYRAFWRDTTDRLGLPPVAGTEPLTGDGGEVEPLIAVRAARAGLKVADVEVTVYPHTDRSGMPALGPALRALIAERRPAATRTATGESIVVMTGTGRVNPPYPDRYPPNSVRQWPAPNPRRGGTSGDRPNSGLLPGDAGFVDRRRGDRRATDRRRGAARLAGPAPVTPGRQDGTAGITPPGRGDGDNLMRRRWRDNRPDAEAVVREAGAGRRRVQGRPNLRVINGEGAGGSGRGDLRSV
ncbi:MULTISPECIES: glycosyltransferase [Actinoplanes]|uniref:glycosyltransferase n=1 Tax=Actinoplanes TaxID=1865 RepID=UPI000697EAE5|nr:MULTISPECIES: glycosyltransferase [Actinoplanes]GLY06086.1 hypothetical protein Acsp01_64650 [Actinoplanes sp. NBRC 101535]